MTGGDDPVARTTLEAGAGRPFRFSLVLGEGRGTLQSWLGGKWALVVGAAGVAVSAVAGAAASLLLPETREVHPPVFACAGGAVGSLVVAWHLRPRRVRFRFRDGGWSWRGRGGPLLSWSPLTEDSPLRLEREILSSVEGFSLYAGSVKILSYLGDPSIGRQVGLAFEAAGVPLRTVVKRADPGLPS